MKPIYFVGVLIFCLFYFTSCNTPNRICEQLEGNEQTECEAIDELY